jgi:hypothetical protein
MMPGSHICLESGKPLLSVAQETGYLPFNAAAAVKLRPNRDGLPGRIFEESAIAKPIDATASPGCQFREYWGKPAHGMPAHWIDNGWETRILGPALADQPMLQVL